MMQETITPSSSIVIAGGGIGGLFAASLLIDMGYKNITLIEKSASVGGLLRSKNYKSPLDDGQNYTFDFGTHFILKTGNNDIDAIIEHDLGSDNYLTYTGSLPEGQFTNGALYTHSGCANAALFDENILHEITEQALSIKGDTQVDADNLHDLYAQKYGARARDVIYTPALKKFTGCALKDLDASLETTFTASRLIIADREKSIALKASHDHNIAFADYRDGHSDVTKHYPRSGGVEQWVDDMKSRLEKSGVRFLLSEQIEDINQEDGTIKSVKTGQSDINCDFLIWTLPAIFLAWMTETKVPSLPPQMRSVSLINFIMDTHPNAKPFWITVYDPAIKSFRVTLYDNFVPKADSQHSKVTVEVLHDGDFEGTQSDQKAIFQELKDIKVIADDTNLLWSAHESIPAGFPITKPGETDIYMQQINMMEDALKNSFIINRYKAGGHGQMSIMTNIYDTIRLRLKNHQEENTTHAA